MSWCDKLASTPAIGIWLDEQYAPVSALLEPLTPLLSKWTDKGKPTFHIDAQDTFGFALSNFEGYQYSASADRMAVEFKHRLRLVAKSAGPPTAEMISKPLPYTQLLPRVSEKLLELVRLISTGTSRKLLRIGVVSTTVVTPEDAPPGIIRFLQHIGKPWNEEPEYYNVVWTAKLQKVKRTMDYDRCIHTISRSEDDPDQLVTIRLDWQRYLPQGRTLSGTSLPQLLDEARADALSYFEDIGEGERFDDSLQSDAVSKAG